MRSLRIVSVLLVTAAAVSVLGGCANTRELEQRAARLQEDKANLERENALAREQILKLQGDNEGLRAQLDDASTAAATGAQPMPDVGPGADIERRGGADVIVIDNRVVFAPGKADVSSDGKSVLRRVAAVLSADYAGRDVRVEGHTDSQPINRTRNLYKSNWELATARSLSVLHFLVDDCNVAPERVYAAGYGQHRPRASNSTPAGRAQNRRVEIVVLPHAP